MPHAPTSYDDVVYGTSDGWRRQLRYKADGDAAWTNVDLTAASAIAVYLLDLDGSVKRTFAALGADSALFAVDADGYLTFEAAADTFAASDVGAYILRVKVTTSSWPAGKVFKSDAGVRITA